MTTILIIIYTFLFEAKCTSCSYVSGPVVVGGVLALLYVVTIAVGAVVIIILILKIRSKK